jgi:hypothetical protein
LYFHLIVGKGGEMAVRCNGEDKYSIVEVFPHVSLFVELIKPFMKPVLIPAE